MTSHVAQFLVAEGEWERALVAFNRSLVPGGRLVFDSWDPADREWEQWNPVDSHQRDELRASLGAAGFSIDQIYGGWLREPVGAGDGEFLVLARA